VATDGKHVVASFGSEGLYAYDMQGKPLWKKDLGLLDSGFFQVPSAQWGFGSSPIIHDGKLIVQADVQQGSFLAAYDVRSGKQLWRTERTDVPTWSTPTVHVGDTRAQILVNGWKHAGGYDLQTGKELWKMQTTGDIPTPTPYVAHGLIFLTNAHGGGIPVYAIKTSAQGDVTLGEDQTSNQYVAWSDPRGGSYMPTTVVYGDELYVLRDNGVFSCRDARSGKLHYKERVGVGSGFTASLVAGDGKIYVTAETGEIAVIRAGKTFEKLAVNEMGEVCMSAPAISEGRLYFRTRGHLVAVDGARPATAEAPAGKQPAAED
jgi:outer membrane protein assembly factor BamB